MAERITAFKGLNNVTDPVRLESGWLTRADNINITSSGGISVRKGYAKVLDGALRSAHTTRDFRRMFVHDGDAIKAVLPDMGTITLATGFGAEPMRWMEFNDQVFFANPSGDGIITLDNQVLEWRWAELPAPTLTAVTGNLPAGQYAACLTRTLPDGRETGAGEIAYVTLRAGQGLEISNLPVGANLYLTPADSTVFQAAGRVRAPTMHWADSANNLGGELLTGFTNPLPYGTHLITMWRGQAYAAQYLPEQDQTVVWWSDPLAPHLWSLDSAFFMVPRRVELLAPCATGLIVGTNAAIELYDGEKLTPVVDYGVVPGFNAADDEDAGKTYFWTQRGLCVLPDFLNLTQNRVSVAPGAQAGAALIHDEGQRRIVVTLQKGGTAFNPLN